MATKDRTSLKNEFKNGNLATGERFADLIDSVKVVQLPVVDPQVLGSTSSFIDSISQDADGKITATKKNVVLNYVNIQDKPQINGHTLNGDMSLKELGIINQIQLNDGTAIYPDQDGNVKLPVIPQTTNTITPGSAFVPTADAVDEALEEQNLLVPKANPYTAAQKYNASANINDRSAVVAQVTGEVQALGYKVLNPVLGFSEQVENVVDNDVVIVDNSNTIFEIRDEFDLDGESVTIPANCTLKFNGGKLKNGTVSGIGLKAEGLNKIVIDEKVFSHGVNLNVQEDYVLASTVGFVENNQDATAVAYNDTILEAVISSGKFLDIDIDMYIGGTHTIASRDFKIRGTGVLRALSGAHFYMGAGGYLEIDNITLHNNSHSFISITTSKLTHLIKGIVLDYVTLYSNTRFINIHGEDQDYAVTNFGIENFSITNCNYYVEENFTQIIIAGVPVTKVFSVSNNYIKGVGYQFINAGTDNSYVNNNYDYYTEYVVQNNTVVGRVFKSTSKSYSCFCLIEAPIVKYIGNNISNLISTGVQGAAYPVYDSYLSCIILYYINNIITNVVELPEDGVVLDTLTEFAKSKGNGGSNSRRYITNNKFRIDFDECRQLAKDNLNTEWTDEAFNTIAKVGLFGYTSEIGLLDFRSNIVEVIKGELSFPASAYSMRTVVKAVVDNNVFNVGKASADGGMLLYQNVAAVSRVFTNNKVIVDYGTTFNVFTTYDNQNTNSNCEIVIKNNISNVQFAPTFAGAKSVIITDNVITEYVPIKRIIKIYSANLNNSFIEFKKGLHLSSASETNLTVLYVDAVNTKLFLKTTGSIFADDWCEHTEKVGIKSSSKVIFHFGNIKRQFVIIPGESYYINEYNVKVPYSTYFSEAFKISNNEVVRFRAYSTGVVIMGIVAKNGCTIEIEPITSVEDEVKSYDIGLTKFDNGRPIWYNGTAWVDALGEPAGLQVSDTSVLIGAAADSTKTVSVYYGGSITPTITMLNSDDSANTWLTATYTLYAPTFVANTYYSAANTEVATKPSNWETNYMDYFTDAEATVPVAGVPKNKVVLTADANNTSAPRGAKVLVTLGDELVIINVVQSY